MLRCSGALRAGARPWPRAPPHRGVGAEARGGPGRQSGRRQGDAGGQPAPRSHAGCIARGGEGAAEAVTQAKGLLRPRRRRASVSSLWQACAPFGRGSAARSLCSPAVLCAAVAVGQAKDAAAGAPCCRPQSCAHSPIGEAARDTSGAAAGGGGGTPPAEAEGVVGALLRDPHNRSGLEAGREQGSVWLRRRQLVPLARGHLGVPGEVRAPCRLHLDALR
mmetsp:Transcript_120528/g.335571  ORF Transcript_120528/g.335571 Transcript_120528/m.335571 type:complete len:220 (-) Transcript_120528:455-1114(-)